MRAALLLLLVLAGALPARAQTVVTSAGPDKVSVTLYRDPNRGTQSAINRSYPQGFALITETRTVTIPAGPAVIRFEGVAGNILPESALVSGLPDGVEEKNLDANLLSPRSLFDRALGRRVLVRRTNPATGKAQLLQATLRSSADGAAVLQFGGAYGDLRCSGLPEAIVYDGVPEGLSAKPTLSVKTTAKAQRQVTLTLSYLSGGFDWQADYVIAMRNNGQSADLFAWITLASTDVTSFVDADTQVVAGKINRVANSNYGPRNFASASYLPLQCWPLPEYDLYTRERFAARGGPPPPPPPPAPVAPAMDIIVTGNRVAAGMMAEAKMAIAEELGDLKLYRFPTRVTVASQSQKQVGLMNKPGVKLAPVYVSDIVRENTQTALLLRGKNNAANGLGAAMPAGKAAVFSDVGGQMLLVGESAIDDKAVDEVVEFRMGRPQSVSAQVVGTRRRPDDRTTAYVLTVTNDQPWPVTYEAKIHLYDYEKMARSSGRLGRKDGASFWMTVVPANGTATLSYAVRDDRKR
ncbi:DUF4139 domain-containing protein [Sphingomonas mali]|uniref:DUF4139 domain-containing protein n=1 Tax=Sphingomonas mali TaxID=40682 RepID=UPI0008364EE0|nr:hypothetical protein [Sphingomonas mali]